MPVWAYAGTGIQADGGYEANVRPADAGWVAIGDGFLGDFVSVQNGVMTYDGERRPAPGSVGMRPSAWPSIKTSGTIEYRVRCRAIGGDPASWYQFFFTFYLRSGLFAIRDNLGHYKSGDEPVIHTSHRLPQSSGQSEPPTRTGRWETDEWITVRHVMRDVGQEKYTLQSWVSGPAGTHRHVDASSERAHYPKQFDLMINSNTSAGARFDLDYLRWSGQAIPYGTPLEPADTAPRIMSIEPTDGDGDDQKNVTIRGGNFDQPLTVRFGAVEASSVRTIDPHTITCVVPGGTAEGWVDVQVRGTSGAGTKSDAYFFGSLPTVSRIQPRHGPNRGGERVAIQGDGFQAGARVLFGKLAADEVRIETPERITCRTPQVQGGWHGPVEVTIVNPDEGRSVTDGLYTYERSSNTEPKLLGWHIDLADFNLPLAIQKLEEMPFHGVLLRPYRGLEVGPGNFNEQDLQLNRSILKAIEFRRFTDTFLEINFTGPSENTSRGFWDDWTDVLASYRLYARLAREAGFKGFFLDVEGYSGELGPHFSSHGYLKQGRTLPQIRQQIKQRARQLMTEVLSIYPDITILVTFGMTYSTSKYDMLPSFYDGLLEAVASDDAFCRARIIDGHEPGYYITTPAAYRHAYDQIRKPGGLAYQRSEHPGLWARFGSVGFGNYPDIHDIDAFTQQYKSAMAQTEKYVWLYTNGTFFHAWAPPSLAPKSPFAEKTDRYIETLAGLNRLPRATAKGRCTRLIDLQMDEGGGTVAYNQAVDSFHGQLQDDQLWTNNSPTLPRQHPNPWSLDLRGKQQALVLHKTGRVSRSGPMRHMQSSHLGNLYFTDHTIEFSFWWDGDVSKADQYLYGAGGDPPRGDKVDSFGYGAYIPAGTQKLVHRQRSNYGGKFGGVEIDLEGARAKGLHQYGAWSSVAIKVNTRHVPNWRIYFNGRNVTDADWTAVVEGQQTVEGFKPPYKEWHHHELPIDLVLGARNRGEAGITDHFDGMLDAFRITAGQVPVHDLLCVP